MHETEMKEAATDNQILLLQLVRECEQGMVAAGLQCKLNGMHQYQKQKQASAQKN